MQNVTVRLAAFFVLWLCPLLLVGQQADLAKDAADLPQADEVRTALKQWVLSKQMISRERAGWAEQQQTLNDLNGIRQQEIKQLGEFTKAAGVRIAEIEKKRKQFAAEEASLKSWRRDLKTQITKLENELRALLVLFPPPLRSKVAEAIERLETADAQAPLQHRTRDVLLVMQAYLSFQNTITLDTVIRNIDGEDREVDVLYMGLTQAWYVDQSGAHSGYGVPGLEGWLWTEEAALATSIRQAIAIQSRQATPDFVRLPFANAPASVRSK